MVILVAADEVDVATLKESYAMMKYSAEDSTHLVSTILFLRGY
jgi:hypothetical protein